MQVDVAVVSAVFECDWYVLAKEIHHLGDCRIGVQIECVAPEHGTEGKHSVLGVRDYRQETFNSEDAEVVTGDLMGRVSAVDDAALRGSASTVEAEVELHQIFFSWEGIWDDSFDFRSGELGTYDAELCLGQAVVVFVGHGFLAGQELAGNREPNQFPPMSENPDMGHPDFLI